MTRPSRALAPALMAFILAATAVAVTAARADTTVITLTTSWQKIAGAGQTVDVQSLAGLGGVLLTTSSGPPATAAGQMLATGDHRVLTLMQDLYAETDARYSASATTAVAVSTGILGSGGQPPSAGVPAEASTAAQPLTNMTLLDTVAAGQRLGWWFCQNQSGGELYVALDDGAGNALSVFALDPAPSVGRQGASMGAADTGPHLGRIRVYGSAGSQHALRVQ